LLRIETLREQPINGQWKKTPRRNNPTRRTMEEQTKHTGGKGMAPQGLAPTHEAAELLNDWENLGCPTKTGREGTIGEIHAAINR